ncbi:hypothetical protein [Priestia flexa]|uniref:hypothetical protein n=1 Tax=Priestia flexa TaxID=86664 RepID=UPI001B31C370|nr:hypothetical protein [Priestia flexa]
MKFLKPKKLNAEKVDWLVSEQVRAIIKNYAEYTEYSESDIINMVLLDLIEDRDFIEWVAAKRNNKRLIKELGLNELLEHRTNE